MIKSQKVIKSSQVSQLDLLVSIFGDNNDTNGGTSFVSLLREHYGMGKFVDVGAKFEGYKEMVGDTSWEGDYAVGSSESIIAALNGPDDSFFKLEGLRRSVEEYAAKLEKVKGMNSKLLGYAKRLVEGGKRWIAEREGTKVEAVEENGGGANLEKKNKEEKKESNNGYVKGEDVLKLVKTNLDYNGRSDSHGRSVRPKDLSFQLIMAAKDDKKLCEMYEGWTAWF